MRLMVNLVDFEISSVFGTNKYALSILSDIFHISALKVTKKCTFVSLFDIIITRHDFWGPAADFGSAISYSNSVSVSSGIYMSTNIRFAQ